MGISARKGANPAQCCKPSPIQSQLQSLPCRHRAPTPNHRWHARPLMLCQSTKKSITKDFGHCIAHCTPRNCSGSSRKTGKGSSHGRALNLSVGNRLCYGLCHGCQNLITHRSIQVHEYLQYLCHLYPHPAFSSQGESKLFGINGVHQRRSSISLRSPSLPSASFPRA